MCRNIKRLRRPDAAPTDAELHDAALQFVRKISGYHAPSRANQKAFDAAVRNVATSARRMFDGLQTPRATAHRSQAPGSAGTIPTEERTQSTGSEATPERVASAHPHVTDAPERRSRSRRR